MKKILLILLFVSLSYSFSENAREPYRVGEYLKYRVHFGFMNAGYATLHLREDYLYGEPVYHAIGKGWTVGAADFFFSIEDRYESVFTRGEQVKPLHFIRRVNEGGYIISRDLFFDHEAGSVLIHDHKKNTKKRVEVSGVQDLVSAFYYLRNLDLDQIRQGDEIRVDLFFDGEIFPFKLKFLNRETVKTKAGEINTWKVRPLVQKGRVFEGQESLTVWISDDENKVPIRIKASLVVGSLKADLDEYAGLAYPLNAVE